MSVDAETVDADALPPDQQLACPTNTDRTPQRVDPDDPRVTDERLCSHCFPEGEIPEDVEFVLRPDRYSNGVHLPLSYDGKQCKFGPYDGYTTYKHLLKEMDVEQFDAIVAGEKTVDEVKRELDIDNGGSD